MNATIRSIRLVYSLQTISKCQLKSTESLLRPSLLRLAVQIRSIQCSATRNTPETPKSMRAWEVHCFEGPSAMKLNESAKVPELGKHEILVKVKASSVNPLDVMMTQGYGHDVFHALRHLENKEWSTQPDFPYIPGRDFAGIVTETGSEVTKFKKGDQVYGILLFGHYGSHAEYTKAHEELVLKKPEHLSFAEAACFPFIGLTCWSALRIGGTIFDFKSKKILILGASGGIGTFGVQYCRAEGAEVFGSCEPEAIEILERLGLPRSHILDYTDPESTEIMKANAPYHVLFDCSGVQRAVDSALPYVKPVTGEYISLNPPNLPNVDNYGLALGALKTATDFITTNIESLVKDKVTTRWGYFLPAPAGLRAIGKHIEDGKILPVVGLKYPFEEMPKAYERVAQGRIIGKLIVEH